MTSMPHQDRRRIVVGVDTHKYAHVAVVLDALGSRLGDTVIDVNRAGYAEFEQWACQHGELITFAIEGTGSYGAGLASFLRRRGHRVVEVNRPDRRIRHLHGKDDPIDAESAARAVLSGTATATPKSADGTVEMIRQIKIAKDTAVKARSQAMITLKTVIVNAPSELREELEHLTDKELIGNCVDVRNDGMLTPVDAARYTLHSLAKRYRELDKGSAAARPRARHPH
jgi:transposase